MHIGAKLSKVKQALDREISAIDGLEYKGNQL
jgi:hypothetical protein